MDIVPTPQGDVEGGGIGLLLGMLSPVLPVLQKHKEV